MQEALQQRLDFVGLGEGAKERLTPISDSLSHHLDAALDDLSRRIATAPTTARFLFGRERIEADGGGLAAHWKKLLAGQIDSSFAEAAMRTGQRHARIGVDPRWHMGSHAVIVQSLIRSILTDGMDRARTRRGPLAVLDALVPQQSSAQVEAMADGIAALVGAVLVDLELTFAGYVDRLRHDTEAAIAAEQARLKSAVATAGHVLDMAAEGRRDDEAMALDAPELAPLREGAEKLADRVIGLAEDLEVSGKAISTLAEQVLLGVRHLSADTAAGSQDGGALARALAELSPAAMAVASGLGEQGRARRTDLRRFRRGARDIEAARTLLRGTDASSKAANLTEADALLVSIAGLFERLIADTSAETRSLTTTDRLAEALVAAISSASIDAAGLAARLATTGNQGEALEQSMAEALESIGILAGLADILGRSEDSATAAEPVFPLPDQTALAAHWHAL